MIDTEAKPPRIRIVGNGDTATVTIGRRIFDGYVMHITEPRKQPTLGSLLVEQTGKKHYDIFLLPTENTVYLNEPSLMKTKRYRQKTFRLLRKIGGAER